jgi:hypothetical protein
MQSFQTIEEIILQHSTRHMDVIQAYFPYQHTQMAADAFLKLPKGVVFIYTGFYVAGYAETDGPLGAYFLALGLEKLGYTPIIITDSFCEEYFPQIHILYIPLIGLHVSEYEALLEEHKPVAHLSIERCGKNAEGKYLNSRGVDIKEFTAPLDELFRLGALSGLSIGIGDGGNEVGMGSFKEVLQNKAYFLDYCVIECAYPIIASVSNWGGYGFLAGLEKSLHVSLIPSFKEVETYLAFIVGKGCVDGIKRESVMSVDGKAWEIEPLILEALNVYARKG